MDTRTGPLEAPRIGDILRRYAVGPVIGIEPMGGTAGATARIATADGSYVLRRRGVRTSAVEHVAFDAAFRRYLRQSGLPAVIPLPTVEGADGVPSAEGFWELSSFVEGRGHQPGDPRQLAALAGTLAGLHRASVEFRRSEEAGRKEAGRKESRAGTQARRKESRARGSGSRLLRQFALSVPGTPESQRIDDPRCMRAALDALEPLLGAAERGTVRRMKDLVGRAAAGYGGRAYDGMDRYVIHGDLHPSNLLFDGRGEVAALFDFDWAVFAPRVRDLADAIWFFAGSSLQDGTDIWALTAARRFDPALARLFLRAYGSIQPVAEEEARALPWAWLARWIAIHLEGMYKVPPADRGRFLTRDMDATVEEILSLDVVALLR